METKFSLALGISFVLIASFLVAVSGKEPVLLATPADSWQCPAQAGTCTSSDWMCVEDLDNNKRACQYQCASAGTWGTGDQCSYNLCEGSRCGSEGKNFASTPSAELSGILFPQKLPFFPYP